MSGRYDTRGTRLLCFSGPAFNGKARAAADSTGDVRLVGLDQLYGSP